MENFKRLTQDLPEGTEKTHETQSVETNVRTEVRIVDLRNTKENR